MRVSSQAAWEGAAMCYVWHGSGQTAGGAWQVPPEWDVGYAVRSSRSGTYVSPGHAAYSRYLPTYPLERARTDISEPRLCTASTCQHSHGKK